MPRFTWKRAVVAAVLLGLALAGGIGGWWVWKETRSKEILGSPTVEFRPGDVPTARQRPEKEVALEPWPTYGFNVERTRVSPYAHTPPYRRLWKMQAAHYIEFPPVVAYGRIYLTNQHGRLWVVNPQTGGIVRSRKFHRCTAASPTVWKERVFVAFMYPLPCRAQRAAGDARVGFVLAMDAYTGKVQWRFDAGAIESSPLVVDGIVYFGSWDRRVYAVRAKNGKLVWSQRVDDRVTSSPAYRAGTIYVPTDGGRLYALDARTGRVRWRASSFTRLGRREYFYATPTVSYGRVFVGNTDGIVYAYGAGTGRLLWAQRAGTYVYTAAAVWQRRVYVGTFDGYVVAFDAATGRKVWRYDAPGSIIGAPTVMGGLVYFSICGTCGRNASRRVEFGRARTIALDARTGRLRWQFLDGKYSPIVADKRRVYLMGATSIYALSSVATEKRLAEENAKKKRQAAP